MRVSTSQFAQMSSSTMLEQQARLLKIQQQVGSGKRILTPSDDPAGATRLLQLDKSIAGVQQFNRNMNQAELSLRTEETALEQVGNVIHRIRELTVQALNASQDPESRRHIATEIRQGLEQLVELGNTRDGKGEYLFAGSRSREKPFVLEGGVVSYRGDQTQKLVQTAPSRQVATNHTGFDVFMNIPGSDGEFITLPDAGNQGTGIVDGGRRLDAGAPYNGPYQIIFQEDDDGELGYYLLDGEGDPLTDDNGDPLVDIDGNPLLTPYVAGEPIAFEGREVIITGNPVAGDGFTVEQAGNRSLFSAVGDLVTALEATGESGTAAQGALFQNAGNRALADLDRALENVSRVRAEVGARLNSLDGERAANDGALLDLRSARSRVQDLDYAEAITELQLRQVGLQAAQQSYMQIQGLSLFNYL